MGNLTFFIPTENEDKFNIKDIKKLLGDNLWDFIIIKTSENSLQVLHHEDDALICDLHFNQECYLLKDIDKDIEYLSEKEFEHSEDNFEFWNYLTVGLRHLKSMKIDINNTLSVTHSPYTQERRQVVKFLHEYFRAYEFDEGIHPEYLPPSYIYNDINNKKENRWKKFLKILKIS